MGAEFHLMPAIDKDQTDIMDPENWTGGKGGKADLGHVETGGGITRRLFVARHEKAV